MSEFRRGRRLRDIPAQMGMDGAQRPVVPMTAGGNVNDLPGQAVRTPEAEAAPPI